MTLISMTGFGESSGSLDLPDGNQINLKVICKSVNNRFLDISLKLPQKLSHLDGVIQKTVRPLISRGRVDISVIRDAAAQHNQLSINFDILSSVMASISKLKVEGVSKEDISKIALTSVLSRKEILDLSGKEVESEGEAQFLESLIVEAVGSLVESRKAEGARLTFEIESILNELKLKATEIERLSSLAPQIIKERFNERLSQLYSSYVADDQRMLQEIAILSDKVDVREEIVRLNSHLILFTEVMLKGGRKLEFIVQEMGREVNTIGSKTSQYEVSALVIEIKSLLERLREQIQNVE